MILETPRLRLCSLAAPHARHVAELAGEWDIASMTAAIPHPYDADMAADWIAGLVESPHVAIAIERDRQLIGCTGYTPSPEGAEVGYWIGRPHWGQGYATEAMNALVAHLRNDLGIALLHACVFQDNPASMRVLEKCGFRQAGTGRSACLARGCDVDVRTYTLGQASGTREPGMP